MLSSNKHQEIKAMEERIKRLKKVIEQLNIVASNKDCEFWTALREVLVSIRDERNDLCIKTLNLYTKEPTNHLIDAKQYAVERETYDFIIKQVDDVNERILDFSNTISKLQDKISNLLKSNKKEDGVSTRQGV